MMLRKLVHHTVGYGIAQISARGAQVLVLLVLPQWLAPEDYGAVQLMLTVSILASFIVPLEVTQGLARYYATAPKDDQPRWASSALVFTIATTGIALALAIVAARPLSGLLLGSGDLIRVFVMGSIFAASTILFYCLQNQLRWAFDVTGYVMSAIGFAIVMIVLAPLLAATVRSPGFGALSGMIAASLTGCIIAAWRLRHSFVWAVDGEKLRRMLRFSIPLVPAQIALFATLYIGRLILSGWGGLAEVGRFTFASQLSSIASLAVVGVQAALTPIIMAHHGDRRTPVALARLLEAFVPTAALIVLALALFAPEMIAILGGERYAASAPLVLPLTAAAMISQTYVFAPGFAIAERTSYQLLVSVVSGVAGVLANLALISRFGATGAAWASLLAAVVFAGLWMAMSQRLYRIPVRWVRIGLFCLLVAALLELLPDARLFEPSSLALRAGAMAAVIVGAITLSLIPSKQTVQSLRAIQST